MLTKSILLRNLVYSRRTFSVLPKNPKVELTVRTPYRTLFDRFTSFSRIYVNTLKGTIAIGNKTIPRIYLLPPGELTVKGISPGDGNNARRDSGLFIHSGGWLFVHDNNSIDVSLIECIEKEDFKFDALTLNDATESDSAAGRLAHALQDKAIKGVQRRR